MLNATAWNTGRLYAEHGQRIAAALTPDGVLFCDIDRGIVGLLRDATDATQAYVMCRYDAYTYENASSATETARELADLACGVKPQNS